MKRNEDLFIFIVKDLVRKSSVIKRNVIACLAALLLILLLVMGYVGAILQSYAFMCHVDIVCISICIFIMVIYIC